MIKFAEGNQLIVADCAKLYTLFHTFCHIDNKPLSITIYNKNESYGLYFLSESMDIIIDDGYIIFNDIDNEFREKIKILEIDDVVEENDSTFIYVKDRVIEIAIDPLWKGE